MWMGYDPSITMVFDRDDSTEFVEEGEDSWFMT